MKLKIISVPANDPYSDKIYKALDDYNAQFGADTHGHEDFVFVMHDDNGDFLGGAQGRIFSEWLCLYSLYSTRAVPGVGTRLMDHVEAFAREKKCKGVQLSSFEFQAPDFYKKRGYDVYGEVENFAGAYKNIYLKKTFSR